MRPLYIILYTVLLSGLVSCGPDKGTMRLKGEFKKLNNAELYIFSEVGGFTGIDTIHIQDGSFVYERPLTEAQVLTLQYPNLSRTYFVAVPGQTVEFKASAERLAEADFSGTEENERLSKFRIRLATLKPDDQRLAAAQYVRDNAATLDGLAVFLQHFAFVEKAAPETLSLLNALTAAAPHSRGVNEVDRLLRQRLQHEAGGKLSAFQAQTLNAGTISPSDFAGKPLLIGFFASWQNDAHAALTLLRRISRAYPGQIGVVGVSLDLSKESCQNLVERDSISFPIVCEGKGMRSPLAQKLGVRYATGNILVAANGIIIARDLKPADLETAVSKAVSRQ